ncbi:MAG: DUF5017 domain-containing protein [Paludibacter sp.]
MKKIILLSTIVVGLVLMNSCNMEIPTADLNFDVSSYNNAMTATTTFHVNDTVNFKFDGNPDCITFYSGEPGHDYRFLGRTVQKSYADTLTFDSKMDTVATNGTLKLYISTNMSANNQHNTQDSLAVLAANWKDISGRATWATSSTTVSSVKVSLNPEAQTDSLVYLAFRYQAAAGSAQSSWSISNILLKHTADNGVYTLLTPATIVTPTSNLTGTLPAYSFSCGWGVVDLQPRIIFNNKYINRGGWIPYNGTTISASGGPGLVPDTHLSYCSAASTNRLAATGLYKTPASAVQIDSWIIAGPIDLSRVLPDMGVQIKNYGENAMTMSKGFYASLKSNFTYRFTKAGTYTVIFEASNNTKDAQVKTTKSITITVQ